MESQPGTEQIQRRNRIQMLAIMAIALISLGGAYLLFYYAKQTGGWGTTNNGEFVQPPLNTEQLSWQVDADQRSWWVWVVADECGADCASSVKDMQALHILLNKESDRVQRGLTELQVVQAGDIYQQYPRLHRITIADSEAIEHGVYIVDPLGNLVLRYPLASNPKLVLDDLKKLLKLSQIG